MAARRVPANFRPKPGELAFRDPALFGDAPIASEVPLVSQPPTGEGCDPHQEERQTARFGDCLRRRKRRCAVPELSLPGEKIEAVGVAVSVGVSAGVQAERC